MHSNSEFQYDPATDTVRVPVSALARLLLQFRTELESRATEGGRWRHMHDYDKDFERLADAVDVARQGRGKPDPRLRCKRTPVYEWPERGTEIQAVRIAGGYGTHYVAVGGKRKQALCGLWFTSGEARRVAGSPECAVCLREAEYVSATIHRA